mmetsp:Transcript_49610/g.105574  ORF Transcript_49610/g.105574 Transcript_49610/m.105574 type:complete len:585 (+) Transcript_49610:79-1833(+)
MSDLRVVIVGGVASGASAAARLRRLSEEVQITIFEKTSFASFANCGLPYYIGGEVRQWKDLQVSSPEELSARYNVDVRLNTEVISIDRENKRVFVKDLISEDITRKEYDHLILATGSRAVVPDNIPGITRTGHFTLRTMEDTGAIEQYISATHPKRIVVCGGGFIGVEVAEQLKKRSLQVTIVEKENQLLTALDPEMAEYIHQSLEKKGVKLVVADGVKSFEEPKSNAMASDVILNSGTRLPADLVILALGVTPCTELAKAAGIDLNSEGYIRVNDRMRSFSCPWIWAVGDSIEVRNPTLGVHERWAVALGGPASKQGRVCAENIIGKARAAVYRGTFGAAGIRVWTTTAACVGLNEKFLKNKGLKYTSVYVHANQHPGWYPGSTQVHLKLIFDSVTGKIYGAQAAGEDGIEKRIDVISTAMMAGTTARDLSDLELCYAPPFGSARDPVNHAGMMAGNVMGGLLETVSPSDLILMVKSGEFSNQNYILLDVRGEAAGAKQPISVVPKDRVVYVEVDSLRPKVTNDPELAERLRSSKVIVSCQSGLRAHVGSRMLLGMGFTNIKVLTGSFLTYTMVDKASARGAL